MHNHNNTRIVLLDGKPLDPSPAQQIARYTRDFEWGTHSSGAALLSLALLLHVVPEQEAIRLRFQYAAEVISNLPAHNDTLNVRKLDIEAWLLVRAHIGRQVETKGVACYA